jgi:hypothetical protein
MPRLLSVNVGLPRDVTWSGKSKGWQSSFQAMLQQDLSSKTTMGNPGLAYEEQAPAWPGFRQMRVAKINKESNSVTSFILSPIDGPPLPGFPGGSICCFALASRPGQTAGSSQLFAV